MISTPTGQVIRDEEGYRLEFVRSFAEPIDDVWSALTDPDRLARWLGRWSGDPASGTVDFVMVFEENPTPQPVRIVECEPQRRLVVELPSPDGTWRLEVTVSAGPPTTMHFVQRLAEPYDATNVGPGWHYYFDRMAAVIQGIELPQAWDEYYPALADRYQLPA